MPQRPLDCSECKKPIAVCYTEIVGETLTRVSMCSDCPHLEKKLHGVGGIEGREGSQELTSLACGNCGTTLELIRKGNLLGCPECYEVFADPLIKELRKNNRISHHLTTNTHSQPLHIGRVPGEITEISPTLRLIALNETLDETLVKEDYEQAALLRDQIRILKEKNENDEEKK